MKKLPSLPKSELEIARIVWDRGRATVREVVEALPADRELGFFTVQTYLRRLAEKGYLGVERQGRANVYVPLARPRRVIEQMINEFLHRVFDGEAVPLLQHLIRDRDLSNEELESLQKMLNDAKEHRTS